MRLIRKDFDLARVEWFMLFSQCCSRNPGREAFEALRWAEKELNALRGALELDVLVMQKAKDVLEKDDQDVEEERRRGLNGEDPSKSREFCFALELVVLSFFGRRVSFHLFSFFLLSSI